MSIGLATTEAAYPVGVHRGVSFDEYHAIDAVSSHRLSTLKRSPAHLRWELDHPTPPTDAMVFGSALHTMILEPSLFDMQYAVAPKCDKRTNAGKAVWNEFVESNQDKTILDADDRKAIEEMASAIHEHEIAGPLVDASSDTELTGLHIDDESGLLCKFRVDAYSQLLATVFDVKTTVDASRREFERAIFRYGYHRQGARYIDGMRALGFPVEHYTIIACEKTAPYAVAVYRLLEDTIRLGREENRQLLQLYAACKQAKTWPGYPNAVQDIGVPAWAKKQIEEEIRA